MAVDTKPLLNIEKPKIFMIGLGGSIAGKEINKVWYQGKLTQKEILSLDPNIKKNFEIETSNLFRLNSADMVPENWIALANIIYPKLKKEQFDGIVITHGTDTMHYSSSALSFLIQNINVPVIFTGSQIISTRIGSDAPRNIYDSLMVASYANLAEVAIVFNRQIFRGNRAKKINAADFDAYLSSGVDPIGYVQHGIILNGLQVKRGKRTPKLFPNIETNVSLVEIFPGFNPKILEAEVDLGAKGIVISGYGVGGYPTKKQSLTPAINSIAERGVPVVLVSQCTMGTDWKKVYSLEVARRYDDARIIFGYDMLPHTALVKLMWVLGQTNNESKIKKMMQTNYAGEISPIRI